MADKSKTISIRLDERVWTAIQYYGGRGLFKRGVSEWVRDAIAAYLKSERLEHGAVRRAKRGK